MKRSAARAALMVLVIALAPSVQAGGASGTWARSWPQGEIPSSVLAQFDEKDSGRYFVVLAEQADLGLVSQIPDRDTRRRAIVRELKRVAEDSQSGILALLEQARAAGAVEAFHSFWLVNAISVRSSEAVLQAIAARPEVERIRPDRVRRITQSPPSGESSPEWNIDRVGAPLAWEQGIDGSGAVVGSIDTGVDFEHPSLADGYRGADGNHDYDWWDAISHEPVPYDDGAHGTHTMGTAVGGDGLGPDPDDIGIAPGATWIAAKAFDDFGGGLDSWIMEAAEFLTAPTTVDGTDPRPELAPDVVNNSWGGFQCDAFFRDVLETWRLMEIFPAFAAGNSGPGEGSVNSPGDAPEAFAVGATDFNDEIAFFSSEGPSCYGETKPEVAAPGENVLSSVPGGGFDSYSGTSMATPHVAGAVALMQDAAAGSLTVDVAEDVLAQTALDLGDGGPDNTFGAGLLQVFDAVEIVLRGGTLQGVVTDSAGAPIAGADVTAYSEDGARRTLTQSDGSYRFRLLPGAYDVQAEAFGYLEAYGAAAVQEGQTFTLDLSLPSAQWVTISGVIDEVPGGAPVAGAEVTVLGTPLAPAVTDASGAYSIEVPEGTFDYEASAGGCLGRDVAQVTAVTDRTVDFSLDRVLDAFGYVCDQVPFVHEPGTTRLNLAGDDNSVKVTLPFPFDFYGDEYTAAWVDTNGYVTFQDGYSEYVNVPIPDPAEPNAAIYALWDDLVVGGSQRGVYTATYGSAPNRRFVIEYRDFELLYTGDLVDFAIVLGEDGAIELRYEELQGEGDGRDATVGLEDPAGSAGFQYGYEEALSDRSAVRFGLGEAGFLAGQVYNSSDGLPIDGSLVSLGDRAIAPGPDGSYQIAAWPGTYHPEASAPGYGSQSTTVALLAGQVTPYDFALHAPRMEVTSDELAFDGPGEVESREISIANTGMQTLAFERAIRPAGALIVDDPADDGFGSIDITTVEGSSSAGEAQLTINFTDSTPTDEVVGFIDLDTDQNPETGFPPFGGGQDTGADYWLDLFDLPYSGTITVWSADYEYMGEVPAEVGESSISTTVPLEYLGDDDGSIDLSMVLGDYEAPSDFAPDEGHGTILPAEELGWLAVEPESGEVEPGENQSLDVTVDTQGLPPGDYGAHIVIDSNDPRRSTVVLPLTLVVRDVEAPVSAFETEDGALLIRARGDRVEGATSDNFTGVEKVRLTFTPAVTGSPIVIEPQLTCTEGRLSCVWSVVPPPTGLYTVTARGTDLAGNVESPGPAIDVIVV